MGLLLLVVSTIQTSQIMNRDGLVIDKLLIFFGQLINCSSKSRIVLI